MKIAIFADVHGNYHALAAVLNDIERERVDLTVCAGDMINPFPDSLRQMAASDRQCRPGF
ncbi:MAG: hypothetical protein B6243_12495 [Anaerolineaceae bacterium 4572_5.2]|nr:MAG: hypothetical protein B6243_12495 [Anaerolineaceae bacterium 4572_5.2]